MEIEQSYNLGRQAQDVAKQNNVNITDTLGALDKIQGFVNGTIKELMEAAQQNANDIKINEKNVEQAKQKLEKVRKKAPPNLKGSEQELTKIKKELEEDLKAMEDM